MLHRGTLLTGIFFLASSVQLFGQDDSELTRFRRFFDTRHTVPLEKALKEADMQLEQAREIRDPHEMVQALRNLALIYLTSGHDPERAMDLLTKALAIGDSARIHTDQILTYVGIAEVFEIAGDFHKSAHFLEQALQLDRDMDINTLAFILNNLGRVNASRGMMEEALSNYQQVLRYRDDIDKQFEADALFNLGHLYTLEGDYPAALANHKKALALSRRLGDRQAEARSLNDIGILYSSMGQEEKCLANHQVALKIRQSLGDKRGIAESYNNIGWFHFRKGDLQQAIENGLLALESGGEAQAQEQLLKGFDLLSQAYKRQRDFENALKYKELGLAMSELIQSETQERHLLETQSRYVIGKKENEIQELEAVRAEREREIAEQKRFRNILFLAVAMFFVVAGLLLILYLVKRRSNRVLSVARKEVQAHNERLQELNQTKDKFFSIISHDLKGPLNSLTSFARLLIDHTDSLSKDEIRMLAGDLDKSVKNLLALLENLLEWSRSQTGSIDFNADDFDLAELLRSNCDLLAAQARDKDITIELEQTSPFAVSMHRNSITTVVRNLISNAIKFTPRGGLVRVGIATERSHFNIFIADNGVGMPAEITGKLFQLGSKHSTKGTANEKGTGLGLILCREFVEKNGGHIKVESTPGKGTVFRCSFPLSLHADLALKTEQVNS